MSKLALLGGQPVLERPLVWAEWWPPVEEETGQKLLDLYRSRKWTAFDGPEADFTRDFAAHHGAKHGIFMVNGTVTMQCALGAYGIGPGDEVIVPALTWYATAMAPHYIGGRPVFVDIKPDTLCIDPQKIKAAITERTKAIIPVHVYGSMADMDQIMAIAREHSLRVIEDCAHAQGGLWDGKGAGTIGDVGSFSFQQSKAMASGEGGICITNDEEVADRIFRMKQIGYGPNQSPGEAKNGPPVGLTCYPFRATTFQTVILHDQLRSLNSRLERYAKGARYLEQRLAQSTKIRFQTRPRQVQRQGYFLWPMIFDDPSYADIPLSVIRAAIRAEGVLVNPTWDPVYRYILFNLKPDAYRVDQPCTVTERSVARILTLQFSHLGLDMSVLEKIADAIEKVMTRLDELRRYAQQAA